MNLEMGSRESRFVAELISLLELNGAIGVVREKCGRPTAHTHTHTHTWIRFINVID